MFQWFSLWLFLAESLRGFCKKSGLVPLIKNMLLSRPDCVCIRLMARFSRQIIISDQFEFPPLGGPGP